MRRLERYPTVPMAWDAVPVGAIFAFSERGSPRNQKTSAGLFGHERSTGTFRCIEGEDYVSSLWGGPHKDHGSVRAPERAADARAVVFVWRMLISL